MKKCPECGKYYYNNERKCITCNCTLKDLDEVKKPSVEKANYGSTIRMIIISIVLFGLAFVVENKSLLQALLIGAGLFALVIGVSNGQTSNKQNALYKASQKGEAEYRAELERQKAEEKRNQEAVQAVNARKYNNYAYTCPMCGSHYVKNISMTKKGVGVATVGLASKTIGKNYKCTSCNYMW